MPVTAMPARRFVRQYAGVQIGYNHVLPSRVLFGVEADATFPNYLEGDDVLVQRRTTQGYVTEKIDYVATLRGRFGYAFDRWMIYGTGGAAVAQSRFNDSLAVPGEGVKALHTRLGWALGGGAEFVLDQGWTARMEYLYDHFARESYVLPSGSRFASSSDSHAIRIGLNRSLDAIEPLQAAERAPFPGTGLPGASYDGAGRTWNIHGQTTTIVQGYPSFRSPYEGANSLKGDSQIRNTMSASAFLGVRLGPGTEFYVNPEIYQGFGLSDVHGVAGVPNGEAQKSNFPVPRSNIARLFVRHTIGLGGEQEAVEDGPNQLAGTRDVSRVTITAGKLAVKDYFDVNTYANDPRVGFMNWNMYGGGSYDWTMDKLSWTWGALAELNQKSWAFRLGYFMVPTTSNANTWDANIFDRGETAAELELRYALMSMPGKVRVFGWANRATMGSYSQSLAFASTTSDAPDLASTRRVRTNYGIVVGVEQDVTEDLGIFSRASWSPGKTEVIGWTDTHDSVSLGAVLKGTRWGRPADRIGLAVLSEGLSAESRAYFAAGGLGIVIGDGRLNYRREEILETYYSLGLGKWGALSADYQFVKNPAYNVDRGPVSIYSTRYHVEF